MSQRPLEKRIAPSGVRQVAKSTTATYGRQRATIKSNLERSKMVDSKWDRSGLLNDDLPDREEISYQSPAKDQPFWDSKTIVFVSWYWPSCITAGILIGLGIAVTML